MNDGSGRVEVRNLTKRFGPVEAVRDLSFTVEPGQVTGFLGPNGAGKTTTLRAALGLVTPTEGEVAINGVRFDQLASPGTVVGAVLDSHGFHRARKARAHLLGYTAAIGVPDRRVDETLALVGLTDAADRKVGGYSLGMRQRLALATALLGDPQVLMLDEPGAGLDPEGIAWLRGFLRSFAGSGRTVLISSHQLAEISQVVDKVVIISQGSRVYEGRPDELGGNGHERVHVRCADPAALATALAERGVTDIQSTPENGLTITGAPATTVGDVALAAGVAIYGMTEERNDLERQFLELTSGHFRPGMPDEPPAPHVPPEQPEPAFPNGGGFGPSDRSEPEGGR
ncbi:MAG: ATP-binding cassette domain-containing protein [Pseudonocardia sp.]|nr:ATP-binding cassette domain-containing protein [Pseudonocardia sp.]